MIKTTKHKLVFRISVEKKNAWMAFKTVLVLAPFVWLGLWVAKPVKEPISPLSDIQPVKAQKPEGRVRIWKGKASWYGTGKGECLGCSADLTMANGEKLDDGKLTAAFNKTPLNEMITIYNPKTGQSVEAKVTDRGGFEKYGKIIDLGKATKEALGCGDVCEVKIQHERTK